MAQGLPTPAFLASATLGTIPIIGASTHTEQHRPGGGVTLPSNRAPTFSSSFSSSMVCLFATSSWTVWPQFFTTDSMTCRHHGEEGGRATGQGRHHPWTGRLPRRSQAPQGTQPKTPHGSL